MAAEYNNAGLRAAAGVRPVRRQASAGLPPVPSPAPSWVDRLNRLSTFASLLCAIDCTVFPILLAVLPLLNIAGPSAAWVHKAAHAVALWFVVPIGGAAVSSNALQHRRPLVFLWGLSGVALVLAANIHLPHSVLPHAVDHFLHAWHSTINVMGCALLLSSQWFSRRLLVEMGKCCDIDHPFAFALPGAAAWTKTTLRSRQVGLVELGMQDR